MARPRVAGDREPGLRVSGMKKFLILLFLIFAGVGLWFFGRPIYRHYKERRLVTQAQAFLKKNELPKAWLTVRQIFALNPTNVVACRIMADLAESSHSPHTLVWRRKVAEL